MKEAVLFASTVPRRIRLAPEASPMPPPKSAVPLRSSQLVRLALVPVASRTFDAGTPAGPISFDVEFPADDVPDADFDKMLSGSFKVVVRGGAATGFETKGADADIQTTFTFAAFE